MSDKIMSTAESMGLLDEDNTLSPAIDEFEPEYIPSEEGTNEQLPPRTVYRACTANHAWKKCMWGLDIGTQNVKVVGLRKGMRKTKLVYLAVVDITPQRRPSKQEVNEQARITAILNALEDLELEYTQISTCLDRASVLVRQIQYPAAARDKLLAALQWEVRKYIPFKPDEVVVDAQIIERPAGGKNKPAEAKDKLDVLLVAATKEHLNRHKELIQRVGIKSQLIDASPLALMNIFMVQNKAEAEETVLLLDIGTSATTLDVLSSKGYYFTLSLSVGGNRFTAEIQSHCQLDFSIAEQLKQGLKPEHPSLEGNRVEATFQKAMEKNYDLLAKEIRQALIYFNKQTGINNFDRMLLTGGGASLPGLSNYLLQKIGIKVEIFNPMNGIEIDKKHFNVEEVKRLGPQMAVAMGLAFRSGM